MSENLIFIDKNTSFNGSIEAKQVVVKGYIKGDITASDKVLVKNGGVIVGDITTEKLLFEEGGQHNGRIRLGRSSAENNDSVNVSDLLQSDEQVNQNEDDSARKTVKKESPKRLW